ncbi:MAG: GatB/YqeY domain-containing protein [Chloroflexota bacterium]
MTLREKIEGDIHDAMRRRDQARLDTLRYLKSAVLLVEKTRRKSLDDAGLVEIIAKQASDRRESIRMFEQGNRSDLVAKEAADLAILEGYLPAPLTQEDLAQLIHSVIKEVGATSARDKGRVMGRLMPQVRGRAEGAQVNTLVTQILEPGG